MKHDFMAEIIVPAVHCVAVHAHDFSTGGRRYVRAKTP